MSTLMRALGMGRQLAEARMTETVTVGLYKDGTDASGNATRVLVTERYSGKARIKYPSLAVTERSEPSQAFGVQELTLSIPMGSPAVREGDEARVTASTVDSSLVGRVYGIKGAPQSGQTTAHRYPLQEL
jgi:hypothetical protein